VQRFSTIGDRDYSIGGAAPGRDPAAGNADRFALWLGHGKAADNARFPNNVRPPFARAAYRGHPPDEELSFAGVVFIWRAPTVVERSPLGGDYM